MKDKYYTTQELANILGISRIAVFNRIKNGKIRAEKFGRNYLIEKDSVSDLLGAEISLETQNKIDLGVRKALGEYGEVFRLLGKE